MREFLIHLKWGKIFILFFHFKSCGHINKNFYMSDKYMKKHKPEMINMLN